MKLKRKSIEDIHSSLSTEPINARNQKENVIPVVVIYFTDKKPTIHE